MKLTDEKQFPATAKFEKFLIRHNLLFPESGLIGECVWANHNAPHIINRPQQITALEAAKKMHKMLLNHEMYGMSTLLQYRNDIDPVVPWDAGDEETDGPLAAVMQEAMINFLETALEDAVDWMLS